jgi:hypothetical protein
MSNDYAPLPDCGWRARLSTAGRRFLPVAVVALTLAPPAYLTWFVASTGAENPSNDHIVTAQVVDQVLAGTYHWRNLFWDSFLAGAHLALLPVLLRLLIAAAFHWNIYFECYATILLAGLKLLLLHRSLAHGLPRPYRLLLWPVLSALVFSASQLCVFTFGDAGLIIQMTQVGLALGLWGLVCFPPGWVGVLLVSVGGLIASYSGGGGPLAWPIFLGCMGLIGYRRLGHYLVFLTAAGAGCLPYVILRWYLKILHPSLATEGLWFCLPAYLHALGLPFTTGWNVKQALCSGTLGAVLGTLALVLCWHRRSLSWPQLLPSLAMLAYALLNVWTTVKFRGYHLAPWYTSAFMTYWLGLAGLACWLLVPKRGSSPISGQSAAAGVGAPLFGWACLAVLAVLFVRTNLTYDDKDRYLPSRAPVSASSLRRYRTAPTYAEQYPFQWEVGRDCLRTLAEPLERHGLSVFAPRQRWTLQGEFPLDSVRLTEYPEIMEVAWWEGTGGTVRPFSHYQHLNLLLHPPNAVHWQITLPRSVEAAYFRSAVALSPAAPVKDGADGAECQLHLEDQQGRRRLLWAQRLRPGKTKWRPCRVSLQEYAGQTVTLHLSADPLGNITHDWILWRYPYVDVILSGPEPQPNAPVRPSNTDLSPSQPTPSPGDVDLEILNASLWEAHDLTPVPGYPGAWQVGDFPYLQYQASLRLPVRDYSHIYVRLGAQAGPHPRYFQLRLAVDTQPGSVEIQVPFLEDAKTHTYTYDLKLLRGLQRANILGVRLDPVPQGDTFRLGQVSVTGLGLIRKVRP